jgi:hypothetical protein
MAVNAQQVKFESDYGFNVPGIELGNDGSLVAVSVRGGDLLISNTTVAAQGTNKTITLSPTGTGTVSTPKLTITSLADDHVAYSNNGAIEGNTNFRWNGTTLSATNLNTRSVASTDPFNELVLNSPSVVTVNAALTATGTVTAPNITATTGKVLSPLVEATGPANKIRFYFDNVASFPDAAVWEGSLAYANDTSKIYYAKGTAWQEVARPESGINTTESSSFSNVSITGGSINGTPIGASTPAAATFTSASVSAVPTLANQLTNKRYVDQQLYLAIALSG